MIAVLAIDTAGPVTGVAVWDAGRQVGAERLVRVTRGAEEQLPTMIDQVCAEVAVNFTALAGVAVAAGPGAFTGLRVGLATAAGFASALRIPVWTTTSLVPRARRAGFGGDLLVLLDARKSRVYAAAWRGSEQIHGPADVDPQHACGWMSPGFRATGEGAIVYREQILAAGGVLVGEPWHPGTLQLARLGAERISLGEGEDATSPTVHYLREADAAVPRTTPMVADGTNNS
jgi:tRNA threonylcarbamoyl adenosine modification protein YeaZ